MERMLLVNRYQVCTAFELNVISIRIILNFSYWLILFAIVTKIRLAGGNVSNAGRVEVNIAGIWGTIRNRGWGMNASNVACRQLGYPGAEAAILSTVGPFGKGEGPVWMSDLDCEGHEDSLWKCSWPRIAGIYWDHDNDAGVVCKVDHSSK